MSGIHHEKNDNHGNLTSLSSSTRTTATTTSSSSVGGGGGGGGGGGPCGACKYLRRKCVRGCVFAPYFDSKQGTAHFAAVHKVFGASNASKLLLRIPPHKRLDAVVSLCYEAIARVRDPVYGCVSHIFTLQQQLMNLQAELAYIQARLSTLQHLTLAPAQPHRIPPLQSDLFSDVVSVSDMVSQSALPNMYLNSLQLQNTTTPSAGLQNFSTANPWELQEMDDGQLHALARVFISSRYLPAAVRLDSSSSRKNL